MLTEKRKERLLQQGYGDLPESELTAIAPWLRLYPAACAVLIVLATAMASPVMMYALAVIALASTVYRHHPFDVIYNVAIAPILTTPRLPPNRIPRRAACAVATVGLGLSAALLSHGHIVLGQLVGAAVGIAATIKATTDYCPVSHMIYRSSPKLATQTKLLG